MLNCLSFERRSVPTNATVPTLCGLVRGRVEDGLRVFCGIPFAEPAVGNLRFRAPVAKQPWTGVLDAGAFGPMAPQPVGGVQVKYWGLDAPVDEDCLTLNVWTPHADDGCRPVMVWIHGGAFVVGSSRRLATTGEHLSLRGDVVVVTVNYRLGVLGWSALDEVAGDELAGSGNNGLLDQALALEWVRDNIGFFGGDPENVTVFGESAGAISVALLLTSPSAKGLIHRAVLQSGGPTIARSLDRAREISAELLVEAGVDDLAGLQDLEVADLLAAQERMRPRGAEELFSPVLDDVVVPATPMERMQRGAGSEVPVLTGTNLDEFRYWLLTDPRLPTLEPRHLHKRIRRNGADPDRVIDAYRASRPELDDNQLAIALVGDLSFRLPQIRMAEAREDAGARTWMYLMTRPSPVEGGRLGCAHAMDIPFVFGTWDKAPVPKLIGDGPDRADLSRSMQDAWLRFAHEGDPSHDGIGVWEVYERSRRSTMIFDVPTRLDEDPLSEERLAWGDAPFLVQT